MSYGSRTYRYRVSWFEPLYEVGGVQAIEIDRGDLVAARVEGDLGAVGERARIAGAESSVRVEKSPAGWCKCRRPAGAAREPEALAVVAQVEDHAAASPAMILLQALERPAVAQGAGRLVEHRGRAGVGRGRVGRCRSSTTCTE